MHALNGSGRCVQDLTIERVLHDCPSAGSTDSIPQNHAHSITVPGAVAGWVDAIEKWGSLSLQEVLEPALEIAKTGFPVAPVTAYGWQRK